MPPNDDILVEILIRLPAESMIRCRAVCKRWRAAIDNPPFVRAHQHQPINKSIIIINTDSSTSSSSTSSCCSLDLESLSFSNGHQTIAATPLDFFDDCLWSAVGACKGLVLTDKPLGIWNPLTHERLDLDLPAGGGFEDEEEASYGLGYDYVTDDYKAVLISSTKPHRTDVYSLKSDSWRTITNCPRTITNRPRGPLGPGVFVCGALNWISLKAGCYPYYKGENKIIALDLGTEKYTLLRMPRLRYHVFTALDVLRGCLILCGSGYNGQLVVSVMKDYGDEGSWIKLLSINRMGWCDGILRPVGFIWKEEEDKMRLQVLLEKDQCSFYLFDVKTNSSKRVFIQGHDHPDLYAQQMFPGTKFCLHDNCGGGARRKKTTSCTKTKKEMPSADLVQRFVFFLKDYTNHDR